MNWQQLSDWLLAPQYLSWLWQGFLLTLWLSAWAGLAATLLGFILAAMRDSTCVLLRSATARCFAIRRCWCSCFSGISPPGKFCLPARCNG